MNATATPADRPVSVARLYRELWRYGAGMHGVLVWALTLLFASQLLKLAVPYFAGQAINAIQGGGIDSLGYAGGLLLAMFGLTLFSWALHGPGRIMERNVALRVRARLTESLMARLLDAPLSWHEARHSAETAHRTHQSASALYDFAQSQFVYLQNAVRLIGPIVALCLIAWQVGLVAVIGFSAIGGLIVLFDRRMMVLAAQENQAERRLSAVTLEALGNVLSVFALRRAPGMIQRVMDHMRKVFAPLRGAIVLNEAKWCTVDVLSTMLWCLLVAFYAWLVTYGPLAGDVSAAHSIPRNPGQPPGSPDEVPAALPLGNVYMVYEYALQAGSVITAIAAHFQSLARQRTDFASAAPILSIESGGRPAATIKAEWQALTLTGWRFHHRAARSEAPSLDGVTLTLRRGRRYALIGPSGSGKSTLLRLLAGLDRPEDGTLDFDDRPVANDRIAFELASNATLIPQTAEIFEGTLRENLTLGADIDESRLPVALATASAEQFVSGLPQGLDTFVAEGGSNWSGGQRQRVALARGVLAAEGSGLVLLDEPTSSLDPETERRVYLRMFEHFADACVVSSVHRLNLLDTFDEVILMQAGRVVDAGSVVELAIRSMLFRDLLGAQGAAPQARQDAGEGAPSA